MLITLVIPVYNRPDEMRELLESLSVQTNPNFDMIIVEDGSSVSSEEVVREYSDRLDIRYYTKENTGPGLTRNFGSDRVESEYILYLDSDCVVPRNYINSLHRFLSENSVDVFGGPDRAAEDFSDHQKAINYSMTSFFTTGGIRGGKKRLDKFFPRSFNMGYRKSTYDKVGGFSFMRYGEDIELSYRLKANKCSSALVPEAFVYHKRRSTDRSFCKQVFYFGVARVNLTKRYPGTLKLVHLLPALFFLYTLFSIYVSLFICKYAIAPIYLLSAIWLIDSTIRNRNLNVGVLSIKSSFIQLLSYGCGMLYGVWKRVILRQSEESSYNINKK